jgi:hypothetical protein
LALSPLSPIVSVAWKQSTYTSLQALRHRRQYIDSGFLCRCWRIIQPTLVRGRNDLLARRSDASFQSTVVGQQ